jgi:hypothetical protein
MMMRRELFWSCKVRVWTVRIKRVKIPLFGAGSCGKKSGLTTAAARGHTGKRESRL